MKCNLLRYLEEQWVVSLRMAKAANDQTPEQTEWLKTAAAIDERRKEHVAGCKKCKQGK